MTPKVFVFMKLDRMPSKIQFFPFSAHFYQVVCSRYALFHSFKASKSIYLKTVKKACLLIRAYMHMLIFLFYFSASNM